MLKYAFDGLLINKGYLFLFLRIYCNKVHINFCFYFNSLSTEATISLMTNSVHTQ